MLNQDAALNRVFQALADPTRRLMVEHLSRGPASVSDLAKPFAMSLPAVFQHLQVLEASGLIRSQKLGRVRTCHIDGEPMRAAERWINERRTLWERRFDRLGTFLAGTGAPTESGKRVKTSKRAATLAPQNRSPRTTTRSKS